MSLRCVIAMLCSFAVGARGQVPADAAAKARPFAALEGTFRDTLGHPVSGGVLRIAGSAHFVRGDDSGFFHLDSVPPGHTEFTATRFGYVAVHFAIEMPASYTVHADVRLRRENTGVAPGANDSTSAPATSQGASAAIDVDALRANCKLRTPTVAITGIVRDESGIPIPYANISLENRSETSAIGERTGCFVMHAPTGTPVTLLIRRIGYHEHKELVTLRPDSSVFVDVRLLPLATVLGGITVTAERDRALEQTGFYDRLIERKKGVGDGWFLTPEDIEPRSFTKITSMLEAFPSIRLRQAGSFHTMVPMGNGGHCIMATYVDGTRFYLPGEAALGTMNDLTIDPTAQRKLNAVIAAANGQGIDETFPANSIAAIEVYTRAAQAPVQYQTLNGGCGIILLWTKR